MSGLDVTDIEYVTCPDCEGYGVQDCEYCFHGIIDCPECNGARGVWVGPEDDDCDECMECNGWGEVNCWTCEGSGHMEDA